MIYCLMKMHPQFAVAFFNFERRQLNFKYKFWSANQDNVDKYFTQHRNNKIKKFKRQAKGKLIMLFININIFISDNDICFVL